MAKTPDGISTTGGELAALILCIYENSVILLFSSTTQQLYNRKNGRTGDAS